MFNPFVLFQPEMIAALRERKRRYIVSQTHGEPAGTNEQDSKQVLLFTDYDELLTASVHFNAIPATDRYRAIIDLEKELHRRKISDMLAPGSKYRVYAAFIRDAKEVEERLNRRYSSAIRRYVNAQTNWRIGSDKTIVPKLELKFGELFVTLKYTGQTVSIRLSELEQY